MLAVRTAGRFRHVDWLEGMGSAAYNPLLNKGITDADWP
jgi:hypothetical protein